MKDPILARDLMSRPVRRLTASTPVRDAAAFLLGHGISGAPVVDARGEWLGVFTKTDLARHVQESLAAQPRDRTQEQLLVGGCRTTTDGTADQARIFGLKIGR